MKRSLDTDNNDTGTVTEGKKMKHVNRNHCVFTSASFMWNQNGHLWYHCVMNMEHGASTQKDTQLLHIEASSIILTIRTIASYLSITVTNINDCTLRPTFTTVISGQYLWLSSAADIYDYHLQLIFTTVISGWYLRLY